MLTIIEMDSLNNLVLDFCTLQKKKMIKTGISCSIGLLNWNLILEDKQQLWQTDDDGEEYDNDDNKEDNNVNDSIKFYLEFYQLLQTMFP